jgi:hypothetical protein
MTRLRCHPNAVGAADPAADLLLEALAVAGKTAERADLLLAVDPADQAEAAHGQNRSRRRKSAWSAPG